MITLYQSPTAFGLMSASPFCMKIEGWLKYHNIPYQTEIVMPNKGPFGKVPYIKYQNQLVADSSDIITFIGKTFGIKDDLTPAQHAQGIAWQRLIEEHLNWAMVYSRWSDEDCWPTFRDEIFKSVPGMMRNFVANMVRKQVSKNLYSQGLGRLPQQRVYDRANIDLQALNQWLSENDFIAGDSLSHYDFCAWAFFKNIACEQMQTPLTQQTLTQAAIMAFCERMDKIVMNH